MANDSVKDDSWVVINPLRPESTATTQPSQSSQPTKGKSKRTDKVPCRFWGTPNGCRAGDQCRFYHDPSIGASTVEASTSQASEGNGTSAVQRNPPIRVAGDRIVPKPVSKQQKKDPRTFEIDQVKRRFSPVEASTESETTLAIKMPPSDPDFPFDLAFLDCVLHVPALYPASAKPFLDVKSNEMERVHQAAIERGFRDIVARSPQSTLLAYMNNLDRQLESLLSGQKEEIKFKLVANRAPPKAAPSAEVESADEFDFPTYAHAMPVYTVAELDAASKRRVIETRQLDARLGRLPLYAKIDEYTYTLPLEPRYRERLPASLQWIKSVHFHVPEVYPLEPCSITIPGVLDEAAILTEVAFEEKATERTDQTLLAHVNYLAQNLHILAAQTPEHEEKSAVGEEANESAEPSDEATKDENPRSHIRVIARPPEWDAGYGEGDSGSEEFEANTEDEDSESVDEDNEDAVGSGVASGAAPGRDQTVAVDLVNLSFPRTRNWHGFRPQEEQPDGYAELVEIVTLCITIQCRRCKTVTDMTPLVAWDKESSPKKIEVTESMTCGRCTSHISVTYHPAMAFPNSHRAGTLDLTGCRVMDLAQSNILLTCGSCSTPNFLSATGHEMPSQKSPHRQRTYCPKCRLSYHVEFDRAHFTRIWNSSEAKLPARMERHLPAEGELPRGTRSLPQNGACNHYARSYRWFRFGCCARMYACDRCHDEAENHHSERAARMLCGFCAREQPFRLHDCAACGATLIHVRGSTKGFWEGGKGTRERSKMSRKDPRKFKRLGATMRKDKTGEKSGKKK